MQDLYAFNMHYHYAFNMHYPWKTCLLGKVIVKWQCMASSNNKQVKCENVIGFAETAINYYKVEVIL